ncbi:MAG: DUF1173 family protein [Hyphomicrobiales bacterium]|nr:DUF1173 family protein [Hyphomicrobiales bacterium]MDE2016522.1 DUF1173 family protein [Hyphomicrobiales bacterium]
MAADRFGHRLIVKRLPKFPFLLDDGIHRRMTAKLSLVDALRDAHLIVIATFGLDANGVAKIDAIALMAVTDTWIPIEHSFHAELVAALTRRGASLLKGPRYNLGADRPLAGAVRQDGAAPGALYAVPPKAEDAYRFALDALETDGGMASWVWNAGIEAVPGLQ